MIHSTMLPGRVRERLVGIQHTLLQLENPWFAVIFAGLFYLAISLTVGVPWRISSAPYYNYLADAFLHGQLHLREVPETLRNLSVVDGRYYLYWGPLPALLVMPFVAVFGAQVSDVLQTLLVGTANVGLFALLLRQASLAGIISLSTVQRAWLVLFFALGTPYTPLPAVGRLWELNSLETVTCTLLAYSAAFACKDKKAFFLAGCGVAGILLTRSSAIFSAVFLVVYLLKRYWHVGFRRLAENSLAGLAPVVVTLALFGLYNYLRFGSPLDNGFSYQIWPGYFRELYETYGAFHPHYVPYNFMMNYLYYPFKFQPFGVSGWGGSLFLLSPLFFAALWALWQERSRLDTWALFVSVLLGSVALVMLFGPGTFQFGLRYSLDYIVPLLLLTGMGMARWPRWLVAGAVILSVLHFLVGSLMYARIINLTA